MFIEWLISFMSPKLNFQFKLVPHTFTILVNVFIVHLPAQPTDLDIFMTSSFPSFITFNPSESPTDSSFATYFKYINLFPFIMPSKKKKKNPTIRTSYPLMVQQIRIHLPIWETQVWSLVPEVSTCHRATKPMHNYWARTLKPMNSNYQTHLLQLPKPACSRAHAAAAAKSCQSCPTLCDPIDSSPPGSQPWDSPGKSTGVVKSLKCY